MLSLLLAVAVSSQQPSVLVERAVTAIGGADALRAVRNTTVDFYATSFAMGQSETAESPPRASVIIGRMSTDWEGGRRVREQEVRLVSGTINRSRRVTAGGIGFLEAGTPPAQTADAPGQVAAVERAMRGEPDRVLLAALSHPEALRPLAPRTYRGDQMPGVRYAYGPDTLDLYFDPRSGLLTVLETVTDDPILGDRRTSIHATRWHPAGAIRLPRQLDTFANGQLIDHVVITSAATNTTIDPNAFAIPDAIASTARRGPPPAPVITVNLVELAPGVWRAEGSTHHTLVVEQGDQLLLAESPQSTTRARAVFDTLRSRFPNKRISAVINTHHHWDHAGGMRAAMAAQLPIVTSARNAGFLRQVAAAPKTVRPDELSRRRRDPTLRLVEDSMVIGSGDSRVVVYRLPSVHAEDVLGVWVPSARIVFTSDVLNPGATLNPVGSRELVAFARARGLNPERYAGGHGAMTNWVDLERAAQ